MLELAGNASKDLKVSFAYCHLLAVLVLPASPTCCCLVCFPVLPVAVRSVALSHNGVCGLQVKRITPRHLQLAIRGDEELDTLIKVCLSSYIPPGDGLKAVLSVLSWVMHQSDQKHCCEIICPHVQATIAGGGVIPHIHKSLINKATKKE